MSRSTVHFCSVCGVPVTSFTVQDGVHRDEDTGELINDARGELGRRYYCKEHMPHLHAEPLEDRIE